MGVHITTNLLRSATWPRMESALAPKLHKVKVPGSSSVMSCCGYMQLEEVIELLRWLSTHYKIKTWPSNLRIAARILLIETISQDKFPPRGGTSVLFTRTMPLRTAARRMRFKAKDTHCPASALVTFALERTWVI